MPDRTFKAHFVDHFFSANTRLTLSIFTVYVTLLFLSYTFLSLFYKYNVFTARRYVSAVYAVVCPSVCPSVRLWHAGIIPERRNLGSRKQRHTTAQGL